MEDFYDLNTASMRLCSSLLKTKDNRLIEVQDVYYHNSKFLLNCNIISESEISYETIRLKDVSNEQVATGYTNSNSGAMFSERMPIRQWKIGLNKNNIKMSCWQGNVFRGYSVEKFLSPHYNRYPSLEEAIRLTRLLVSVAFSRNYSITDSGAVYYKGVTNVGTIKYKKIKLYNTFLFLSEDLDNALCNSR